METTVINATCMAMASSPPGTESTAPGWVSLMPILLIFFIFYFILIRPQQKQQKEHQKLVDNLKSGDQVLLGGGIYGTIMDVKDKTVLVKVADNVKLKVLRSAVTQVIKGEKEKAESAA